MFIMNILFPQKLFDAIFTIATPSAELQLLNLCSLKVMLRMRSEGVTTMKPGYQTAGKVWYGQLSNLPALRFVHQEQFTSEERST
jgi:hypothetical protein